jgi:hypothetical protein
MNRPRLPYLLAVSVLIVLALGTRHFSAALPRSIVEYAPDTLWATMVYCAFGFVFPRWPGGRMFIVALLFCYAAETSQLYHAPWIDGIRRYRLGGLLLGYTFLWSDMACYTVGVTLGRVWEWLASRR